MVKAEYCIIAEDYKVISLNNLIIPNSPVTEIKEYSCSHLSNRIVLYFFFDTKLRLEIFGFFEKQHKREFHIFHHMKSILFVEHLFWFVLAFTDVTKYCSSSSSEMASVRCHIGTA